MTISDDDGSISTPIVSRHDKLAQRLPIMWETAWFQWWWLLCNGVPVWLVPSNGEIVVDRNRTYIEVKLFDYPKDGYLEYGRVIKYEPGHMNNDISYVIVRYPMHIKPTDFGEYKIAPYVAATDGGGDA